MKFLLIIIPLLFLQPNTGYLVMQIINPMQIKQSAEVKIFQDGKLIGKTETKGNFSVELPYGKYEIEVIKCDSTYKQNLDLHRKRHDIILIVENCKSSSIF